jgi:C-terminal processing protease CtpA/Prc
VFPKIAIKMSDYLKMKFKNGQYDQYSKPADFAKQLTSDLQQISQDKHLRVRFDPTRVSEIKKEDSTSGTDAIPKPWLERMRRINYGFMEAKILLGNVGYLDIRGFVPIEYGAETAVAAMKFVLNSDAVIFDLRRCGGGRPEILQLIISYLFDSVVHLNDFYFRPDDSITQTWTLPYVPGKRKPEIDVYVLTSKSTFSAGEEFAYDLRSLDRATLIGESTGGGAHPGGEQIINDRFYIWVPSGRAINPITKTNWEGTGVIPHINVSADQALKTAHLEALKGIRDNCKDDAIKSKYSEYIERIKQE